MIQIGAGKTIERLSDMLDAAIEGTFEEQQFDETELSRLEARWKQYFENASTSKANIEREKENIKSLISDISHQTKTPIANLKLYEELLEERLKEQQQEEELEFLSLIRAQTEKLDFLIQSLTKMSRLESNILVLDPEAGSVKELLEQIYCDILPKAQQKGMHLIVDCGEEFQVNCDRKWTREALYNLADNAVKYSPEGSKIVLSAKRYELYGAIIVKDEGMGMSESEIPKVFQRFYRSEKVSAKEGVGIGLFLAREIIRKQNGYIKVRSEEGKGSEFAVYLPKL